MSFQGNAFQKNAFQTGAAASVALPAIGWLVGWTSVGVVGCSYYQSVSDVLPPPPVVAATLAWQPPLSGAPSIPRSAPASGSTFVSHPAAVDNTTTTVWPLVIGEKAKPVAAVSQQGYSVSAYPYMSVPTLTTTLEWQPPLSRSINIPRPAPQGFSVVGYQPTAVPNLTTTLEWQPPLSRSVAIPYPAPQGFSVFGYPYTQSLPVTPAIGWLTGWTSVGITGASYYQSVGDVLPQQAVVPNIITTFGWQTPLSTPVDIPYPAPSGFWAFGTPVFAPAQITVTTGYGSQQTLIYEPLTWVPQPPTAAPPNLTTTLEWQPPLSVAVRIPYPAPVGGQPFAPLPLPTVQVVLAGWQTEWASFSNSQFFYQSEFGTVSPPPAAVPNLTTTLEWQPPLSVAVGIPRSAPQGYWAFVQPVRIDVLGGWLGEWISLQNRGFNYESVFYVQPAVQPPNTTTLIWPLADQQPAARPYPPPAKTQPNWPAQFVPIPPNTITGIPWLMRWPDSAPYFNTARQWRWEYYLAPPPPVIPPIPPIIPPKAMSIQLFTRSGLGKSRTKTGRGRETIRSGKGKSRTEHDP